MLCIMEIRERAIRIRLIDPEGHRLKDLAAHRLATDGRDPELPVGLGVQVAAVEGEAVFLADCVVPVGLKLVDVVGDEAGFVAGVVVAVAGLDGFLGVVAGGGGGRSEAAAVAAAFEVEAEEGVGVEVVEGCPGAVPVVGEFGVGAVARDGELFPFGDVGVRDVLAVVSLRL